MPYRQIPLETTEAVGEVQASLRGTLVNIYDDLADSRSFTPEELVAVLKGKQHKRAASLRDLYASLETNITTLVDDLDGSGLRMLGLFQAIMGARCSIGSPPYAGTEREDPSKLDLHLAVVELQRARRLGAATAELYAACEGEQMAYLRRAREVEAGVVIGQVLKTMHPYTYDELTIGRPLAKPIADWLLGVPNHYPYVHINHVGIPHAVGAVGLMEDSKVSYSFANYLGDVFGKTNMAIVDIAIGCDQVKEMIAGLDGGLTGALRMLMRDNEPSIAVPYIVERFGDLSHGDRYDAFFEIDRAFGSTTGRSRRRVMSHEGKEWLRALGIIGE